MNLRIALQNAREGRSLRDFAEALGLPADSGAAVISKILAGKPVSQDTERRVGRALGIVKQPRRLHRVVMTDEQFRAWQALTTQERNERLGV